MFEILSALLALFLLLSIAFPERFVPKLGNRKKKVGSAYWGVYEGSAVENTAEEGRVEIPKPAKKFRSIYGSSQYETGKGTSFRR